MENEELNLGNILDRILDSEANKFGNLSKTALTLLINYLKYYGYLPKELSALNTEVLVQAVRAFQEFFGLLRDGIPGPRTMRALETPRCGCVDIPDGTLAARRQYVWNKVKDGKPLTFGFSSYLNTVDVDYQIWVLQSCFDTWGSHTNLKGQYIKDYRKADLVIGTGSGKKDGFDGPGGTLAWCQLPTGRDNQLDMKFDESETFITHDSKLRGIILLITAMHELGHGLGLEHSNVQGALMAPYYNPKIAVPQQNDDVPRIQGLYGRKVNTTPSVPSPVSPEELTTITLQVKELVAGKIPGYRIVKE